MSIKHTKPYTDGRAAMSDKIDAMGWEAARDEFNLIHPPGKRENLTPDGAAYAHGEFDCLSARMPARPAAKREGVPA